MQFLITHRSSLLLCLLNNLDHAPALVRGDGAGLDDANLVADGRALLVVRHELRRAADVAAVLRVLDETIDAHDARLLHLVRRHDADLLGAAAAVRGLVARRVASLRVNACVDGLRQGLPRLGRLGRVLRRGRRHFFFSLFCHLEPLYFAACSCCRARIMVWTRASVFFSRRTVLTASTSPSASLKLRRKSDSLSRAASSLSSSSDMLCRRSNSSCLFIA